MTYPETIKYLESFINYEKIPAFPYKESLKLERISGFLTALNNPQDDLKSIHTAGTKGKGSTCAFLTYILRQAGYKVGLYTSPHLSDFRERIRILRPNTKHQIPRTEFEGMISQNELTALTERLKPTIENYNRNSKYGPLSFFEVYTALAFIYFKEKKVDFAVLETGLGGRLDATNVVEPLVCASTPISLEHTQKLGNTLREIAAEKAGIIKGHQVIVISAPQKKE
ncbi:MAG: bifunctional folylpolyglutamate synthase/dihydrofolate synthase, partial [Candidatus Omnitrophica bacterium]|nr:bifunctional folylpolyglutamate synthase/dihydrofolate synthase [Candidatus Omnitrophota bacterium]